MRKKLEAVTEWVTERAGSPYMFVFALLVIANWLIIGLFIGFSDTFQLVINTVTNATEFAMVFAIQATQNRETRALQVKVDELIRAQAGAKDERLTADEQSDEELQRLTEEYHQLGEEHETF